MKKSKEPDTDSFKVKRSKEMVPSVTPKLAEPVLKDNVVPNSTGSDLSVYFSNSSSGGIENVVKKLRAALGDKTFKDSDIEAVLPNLSKEKRVDVLNQLLLKNQIEISAENNVLVYKWKTRTSKDSKDDKISTASKTPKELLGLDAEEKVVFYIIKEAGNKGIWMRDIRLQSNILPNQLNKVLKSMENKKIIKAVKSVSAYKKKVYMLYNLEPDNTLTGGSWYQDQDFESEFVDVLNSQCYRFLLELRKKNIQDRSDKIGPLAFRNTCSALPKDVWKFISDLGISKIPLSEDDIKIILETLVYDGKVERKNYHGVTSYRAVPCLYPTPGIGCIPCSTCPIIQDCHEVPHITAEKCQYLDGWLKKVDPVPLKLKTERAIPKEFEIDLILKGVHGKSKEGDFKIDWTSKGPQKKYVKRCNSDSGITSACIDITDSPEQTCRTSSHEVWPIEKLTKEEIMELWRRRIAEQLGGGGKGWDD